MAYEGFKEDLKGHPIERRMELGNQLAQAEIDGTKKSDGFSRRSMEEEWIGVFRRNPHDTAGPMLLEMALIQAPHINALVSYVSVKFFYMPFGPLGPPGQ
jgi:hypothetical protein